MLKNETLKGVLTVHSNYLDMAELTGSASTSAPATKDTVPMRLIQVPANIDFMLNAAMGKVLVNNLKLENLKGNLQLKEATASIVNLAFNMLGGSIALKGSYATPTKKNADMKFTLDIKNCDIQQTIKTFATIKKIAPIAERCNGNYSSTFSLNGKLDEHMDPEMNTLNGNGKLQTGNVSIVNFPPLIKIADALKMDQYKAVSISNVDLSFDFIDGRIYIKPFETSLAGNKTKVEGSNGFDQSIDYKLDVEMPTNKLPSAATSVVQGIISQANSSGAKLSMGDNINLRILMGGTIDKPTIKTGMKETAGKMVDQLKEKVKQELDQKKKELEDKAKAETERIKKEALDKAKTEADRLKKEAEAKVKAESERLKKEAEKKAKDALKGLFK